MTIVIHTLGVVALVLAAWPARARLLLILALACVGRPIALTAQSPADSTALGSAIAKRIVGGLRPAPPDSTVCRVGIRWSPNAAAIEAGFRAVISSAPKGEWILARADTFTPFRGLHVLDVKWRGDTARVTVRESGAALRSGGHFYANDAEQLFSRTQGVWQFRGANPLYFSDGTIVGDATSRCQPAR